VRIEPLTEPFDPPVAELLAAMMPAGAEPIALFRTFAKNHQMTAAMRTWGRYELSRQLSIDLRTREIVIDRTCARCGCEYEWGVHIAFFGERAGLGRDHIRSLTHGGPHDDCWAARQNVPPSSWPTRSTTRPPSATTCGNSSTTRSLNRSFSTCSCSSAGITRSASQHEPQPCPSNPERRASAATGHSPRRLLAPAAGRRQTAIAPPLTWCGGIARACRWPAPGPGGISRSRSQTQPGGVPCRAGDGRRQARQNDYSEAPSTAASTSWPAQIAAGRRAPSASRLPAAIGNRGRRTGGCASELPRRSTWPEENWIHTLAEEQCQHLAGRGVPLRG
jgi:hypothetical protein